MTAEGRTRPLLDLDPDRPPADPVDAATLVLVRDGAAGIEVFCVERSLASRFMAGAIVFPGGRVEPDDHDAAWDAVSSAPPDRADQLGAAAVARALTIAACRESLEEAAILPVASAITQADALALRQTLAGGAAAFRAELAARRLQIDRSTLVPFARWVTPAAERRRFDARFFMLRAPQGQPGVHDERETTRSLWDTPAALLDRWRRGEIQLAPPTHHTLWTLSLAASVDDALAAAAVRSLDAIHPHLIEVDGTWALTLPGDPAHPRAARLIDGATRYVLRDDRWQPGPASRASRT